MKLFDIEVEFYAKLTNKTLYTRYYTIMAEDEEYAKATVHNHLTMLDFYNFRIVSVKEVGMHD